MKSTKYHALPKNLIPLAKFFEQRAEVKAGEYLYNHITDHFYKADTDDSEILNRNFPSHDHIHSIQCTRELCLRPARNHHPQLGFFCKIHKR